MYQPQNTQPHGLQETLSPKPCEWLQLSFAHWKLLPQQRCRDGEGLLQAPKLP